MLLSNRYSHQRSEVVVGGAHFFATTLLMVVVRFDNVCRPTL
jgi:hypothetical protein